MNQKLPQFGSHAVKIIDNIDTIQEKLERIEDFAMSQHGGLIIAGDFNARAVDRGMPTTDARGKRIEDMVARLGVTTVNTGSIATFRRPGCEGTIPDVTFASDGLLGKVKKLHAMETYTASGTDENLQTKCTNVSTRKWNVNKLNTAVLLSEIDRLAEELQDELDAEQTVKNAMDILVRSCNKAMPKAISRPKRKEVYWWNTTIDESRLATRRGEAHMEHDAYKDAKKQLQNAIERKKKQRNQNLPQTYHCSPQTNCKQLLKTKKAPGPDGIPTEVIKANAQNRPNVLLTIYNICLMEGTFPDLWKTLKLVLLSKGKSESTEPSAYRPLCMLDTAGKLLQRLIKPRLNEAIQTVGGLSRRLYGFRPGKSTVGALKDVIDTVEGMRLDSMLTYSKQIEYATTKSARITSQFSQLMANIGGPLPSRRKILMEACNSVMLYGSEIWAPALKTRSRAIVRAKNSGITRNISIPNGICSSRTRNSWNDPFRSAGNGAP
ncbi:uncharacterized protein [Musca autumnalis]|uniref:uncharacterized protein n=1 Tax=Musca autumnalis TaxID=221902 RepID=UPI003CEDE900